MIRTTSRIVAPDQVLVALVRADRESEAFNELYRRHTPSVRRRVEAILGASDCEVDDVVQETWIRALRSLDTWHEAGSFGGWLCTICTRTAFNAMRRRRRLVEEVEQAYDDPGLRTDLIDIERAASRLSPRWRQIFALHDVAGFTHQEISKRLGIAVGTSKTALFRARRALRDRL